MGSQNNPILETEISFYSEQIHSIQGLVKIYSVPKTALFIFRKKESSKSLMQLKERINSEKCKSLCEMFQKYTTNENDALGINCSLENSEKIVSYWSFYNFNLANKIANRQHNFLSRINITQPIEQGHVWSIISQLCEAGLTLMNHGVYLDFLFENVHMTPFKKLCVYWGNINFSNSERNYFQGYEKNCQFNESFYSPQECKLIKDRRISTNLDLQRCSIFSFGMLVLCFAQGIDNYSHFYDNQRQLKTDILMESLGLIKKRYSHKLYIILKGMLELNTKERINFGQLRKMSIETDNQIKVKSKMNVQSKVSLLSKNGSNLDLTKSTLRVRF